MPIKTLQGILYEIVENKKQEVESRKKQWSLAAIQERIASFPPVRNFSAALSRKNGPLKLLAEIKAASPSAGTLRAHFDPAEIARLFEEYGASAVSVLTDSHYFSGTDEHMQTARTAIQLPVLRKDFTIDEYQIYESRALGADAILLMSQVLQDDTFIEFYQKAKEIGLHILAEGHSRQQIEFLVSMGAEVIGINNRDFDTMTTDIQTTLRARDAVPSDRVLVSQSGFFTREDVQPMEEAGVDAIQVGTSIMQQHDMKKQLAVLLGQE